MDYGSQKMEELIEKIESMSGEEFNALCERAEKDLHMFSISFDQEPDNKHKIISNGVPVLKTDMLFKAATHVPYSITLGQPRSWLISSFEPLNFFAGGYATSLSMFANTHVMQVSGLTTNHLGVTGKYRYDAYVGGIGRVVGTIANSSYEIISGERIDYPSGKEEEGDAWALAA